MTILEKIISKHSDLTKSILFPNAEPLLETKQLIPNIRIYYDIIWNKVSSITGIRGNDDYLKQNKKTYNINIDEKDFENVETFFKKLNFSISLTLTNDIDTYEYNGGYTPQPAMRDIENGKIISMVENDKLPVVKIYSVILSSVTSIREAIAATVYHEFTHAYEDYQRIKKGRRLNSIRAYTVFSKYDGINTIRNSVPGYAGEALGHVIYMLKQVEKNAYVSQAIGEIEMSSMTGWADDLSSAIKRTKGYENYKSILDFIKALETIDDENIQQKLLAAYNTNAGIIGKYNGVNKKYTFKTYKQMINWLKKKTIYLYDNFIEKLARHFENTQIRNKFSIK